MAALVHGDLEVVGDRLQLVGGHERSDAGVRLERIPQFPALGQRHQALLESTQDGRLDDDATRRGALLPGAQERPARHLFGRLIQVRIRQHHRRVLATQLELDFLAFVGRLLLERPADAVRASKRDGMHGFVGDQDVADLRASAQHQVEHAGWQTRVDERLQQVHRRERHELGRLPDHGIAIRQRRRDLPGRDRDRKIPRRDRRDDADGLAARVEEHPGRVARIRFAVRLERLAGEVAQDLHGAPRLANALGERLALFAGQVAADVGGALLEQVGGFAQDVAARRGGSARQAGNAAAAASTACAARRASA